MWRLFRLRTLGVNAAINANEDTGILIVGGTGLGMRTAQAIRRDYPCEVYFLRKGSEGDEKLTEIGVKIFKADARERDQVDKVFNSIDKIDAVVSCISGTMSDVSPDREGGINLVEAAVDKGVELFVHISCLGVKETKHAIIPEAYSAIKQIIKAKEDIEDKLKESGLEYVIIRPAGYKIPKATGGAVLTEDPTVCASLNREDMANLISKCLFSSAATNKTLSAIDPTQSKKELNFVVFQP